MPERPQMPWLAEYYFHIALFCYAYARDPGRHEACLSRAIMGFIWPTGKSYVWSALILSASLLGALTMLVRLLERARRWPPALSILFADLCRGRRSTSPAGRPSKALLSGCAGDDVSRLSRRLSHAAMPGRIRIGSFSMNGAGIVAAPIFALSSCSTRRGS